MWLHAVDEKTARTLPLSWQRGKAARLEPQGHAVGEAAWAAIRFLGAGLA
jgi:hypothetical protein